MGVHVPHDVVSNHILPRIPAKSVLRFNCVSKEWHSFLTSDMFQNKHNRHVDDHKNNLKLLIVSKTKTSLEFTNIDCEAPPNDKGLIPTSRPLTQFGCTTPHDIHILTTFHGLVCLRIIKVNHLVRYSDLILWNPLTNEYKRLSKSHSHMACSKYSKFGLYYSCCEDDYKLLCLNHHNSVYIYSLKSDSWRKVDAFQSTHILYHGHCLTQGTYLNENLYFLQQHSKRRLSSVIRFDTKTELFSKIETPKVDGISKVYDYFATIVVKGDCIHVCVKYDTYRNCDIGFGRWSTCIKLWKLDKDGKMIEVVNYQLRLHDFIDSLSNLIPFHLMKNGSWLMLNNDWAFYNHQIYKVDLKKKTHIKDKEQGNIYDDFEYAEVGVDGNNIIVAKEGRYIETFVSPNRY